MPVIVGEIEKLSASVQTAEIERARAQAKAGILMSLENPHSRCEWMARHLPRYGRVIPATELVTQIEQVDSHAIQKFAARLMSTNQPALAALGQTEGLESYEQFASRFGS